MAKIAEVVPACPAIHRAVSDFPDVVLEDKQGNTISVAYHIHADGTGCVSSCLDCESGGFIEDYCTPVRVPLARLSEEFEMVVWHAADWWLENGRRAPAYQRQLRKARTQIEMEIDEGYSDLL